MEIWIALGIFAVALVVLWKSGDWFVDGAVGIAQFLRLPEILIGIVLVAFCTTLPEMAVSVQAAAMGHPEISLGNAIGSVMADEGFALSLAALLSSVAISIHPRILRKFGIFLVCSAAISYGIALDAHISRSEGLMLSALLLGYMFYLVRSELKYRDHPRSTEPEVAGIRRFEIRRLMLKLILGGAGIVISARALIESGVQIARYLGVPEIVIGLSMIAIGTSLPEITVAAISAYKAHAEISAGNVLGADVLNILWIIGVSASVNPITVNPATIEFSYPWMVVLTLVTLMLMRHRYSLVRWKGGILLFMYIVYLYHISTFFIG